MEILPRNKRGSGIDPRKTHSCNLWYGIMDRCYNEKSANYHNYGGRGIKVCDEWLDMNVFREWVYANGIAKGLQIDRIDSNKGYSPDNCRFITCMDNQRNRRNNVLLTAFGETKCLAEWVQDSRCSISHGCLTKRYKLGLNHEDAISLPKSSEKKHIDGSPNKPRKIASRMINGTSSEPCPNA
jgi:hypothetical protein